MSVKVKPDSSLNVEAELVKTVQPVAHELAAKIVYAADVHERNKLLAAGRHVREAQFQPISIDGVDVVAVSIIDECAEFPCKYNSDIVEKNGKYLIVDRDYVGFFANERFAAATKKLREDSIFDSIAGIDKFYLEYNVLVKRHLTQQYLTEGRSNPEFAPGRLVFTVSAGSEAREEIVKYAPFDDNTLLYGPFNPVLPELLATPEDKTSVRKFLGIAHFIIE